MSTPYSVEQHIALKRVTSIAAAPDGSWLAVAVQRLDRDGDKYVSDLWRVPTDGGPAVLPTRGESKDVAPYFRHDGALGFLSNRQPNEIKPDEDADKRMQVWLLPAERGEPRQLTDEPLGVEAFRFARKADRMVLFAPVIAGVAHDKQRETAAECAKTGPSARRYTRQPVRHWDHWLHEDPSRPQTHLIACTADGTERTDLTPQATRELSIEPALDISDDGRRAVATWASVGADREEDHALLVVDLASGSTQVLGAATNTSHESPRFSPDGASIASVRSTRSAQSAPRPLLTLTDIATGSQRQIAQHWDRWPQLCGFGADGKTLLVTADDDGLVPAFAVDAASGAVEPLVARATGGSHSDLVPLPDGRVACIRSTLLDAPECVLLQGGAVKPLARLSGFAPAEAWAQIERIDVPSTDGVPIQVWIVKPANASGKLPTVLSIHGGPMGMWGDGWHWRWNPLLSVAAGYALVLPNPRGSTGFGQDFVQGIWGNVWGAQCYADLMAVGDALERRAEVDGARMMAMGGSFGGYMTNWIGTQTQRFKCLITHASIVTMARFTGTTDHPAWWYLEMGGREPLRRPRALRPLRADLAHHAVEDADADHPRRTRLPLPIG